MVRFGLFRLVLDWTVSAWLGLVCLGVTDRNNTDRNNKDRKSEGPGSDAGAFCFSQVHVVGRRQRPTLPIISRSVGRLYLP